MLNITGCYWTRDPGKGHILKPHIIMHCWVLAGQTDTFSQCPSGQQQEIHFCVAAQEPPPCVGFPGFALALDSIFSPEWLLLL